MAKFMIKGHTTIDINVEVEADTLEEAIEIADSNISISEDINGGIFIEQGWDEAIENAELSDNGWFEWDEEWCEEL